MEYWQLLIIKKNNSVSLYAFKFKSNKHNNNNKYYYYHYYYY